MKILIAEDDPVSSKILQLALESAGHEVVVTDCGESAWKAFDAAPKKFAAMPEKEALFCPVMGHSVKSVAAAGGFVDHEGVRYYVCCGNCLPGMRQEPGKYAPKAASAMKTAAAVLQAS